MKRLLLALIFMFPLRMLYSQEVINLDSCYILARENYPNLKQSGIYREITTLQKENIGVNYLPKVVLNGQVTYQSDVTGIDISLPNVSIPQAPKDQYKAYAEIRQQIWDGGVSAASAAVEDILLQNNLNELEVELYRLNEQVAQAFFTVIIANKQLEVLNAQQRMLEARLQSVESAVKHGTAEKSSISVVKAEILNLEQNKLQMESVKSASIEVLSIYTGKPVSKDSKFMFDEPQVRSETSIQRPEMQLFDSRITQFEKQMQVLDKSRNPKFFGFGQTGYGRPGLNMLNDEFDAYYLVGAGISWTPFDWKESTRQKKVLQLQQEKIKAQEATFVQNLDLLLARQQEEINKLEKMLDTDRELVSLRSEVTKAAASKLENETITDSEYIREVQSETIAKLKYELHKIQLDEAKEKCNIIKGSIIESN